MTAERNPDKNFITVVSGLPRSGTSLMMRMLEKGGVPVLTDGLRAADDDNPLGYYEFEPVKRLSKDASWLSDARGKVVKAIYAFLYQLPAAYHYKVIFLNRKFDEVIASQKKMLRHRQEQDVMTDQQLMESYNQQLLTLDLWIRRQENFAVYYVDYGEILSEPARIAFEISRFLDLPLDTSAMAESVVPSLHRNRSETA